MDDFGSTLLILFAIAMGLFWIVSMWRVLEKAGQPGWGILIPIYNAYLFLKVAGRPGWWLLLIFVPIVNIVVQVIVAIDIAKNFGKEAIFGFGLFLFGFIFFPILAFGSANYQPQK